MSKTTTPKKNLCIFDEDSPYSPVILPESPADAKQKSLTGLPRVARDTVADIYNNIQHWNTLHITGASLINEIAGIKSNNNTMYPEGLETLIVELSKIVSGLEIIRNSLETCASQLVSLIRLHKSPVPLFVSWTVEKMAQTGKVIADAYNQEFKLKQFVTENICHTQNKDKIMLYAACWTHQPYITSDIQLDLESFLIETGHRNKC